MEATATINQDSSNSFKTLFGLLSKIGLTKSDSKQSGKPKSFTDEIVQAHLILNKSPEYQTKHREFLKKVFTRDLKEYLAPNGSTGTNQGSTVEDKKTKLIKEEEKPKKVILADISENASRILKDKFGGIFNKFFDKFQNFLDKFKTPKGSFGLIGGGIALLLGGLTALVTGLMTDGPFKGLLKILAKMGLPAAIKMIEVGVKLFIGNLRLVFDLIGTTIKDAAKFIGRLFGRNVYKTFLQIGKSISTRFTSILSSLTESITNMFTRVKNFFTSIFDNILTFARGIGDNILKSVTGLFSKVAGKSVIGRALGGIGSIFSTLGGKLFKMISPVLKRIPGIGTIISWGFAYTRFKSGDTIGGIIDVLSGIATLFPGVGTVIGIGLDVLNAFLDFKTGGATAEASIKKGNIVKDWLSNAWNYWKEKILNIPIIKNIIETGEAFSKGDWALALTKLIRIIPNAGWILDWMGMTEDRSVESLNQSFNALANFWTWVKESVFGKIGSMISSIINWSKEKLSDIISYIPGFGDEKIDPPVSKKDTGSANKQSKENNIQLKENNEQPEIKLATGGVVTKPTTALMGEAGPEAVIPLEKYFNTEGLSLNNTTLESIASNTKDTNASLRTLSEVLIRLVGVIDRKLSQTQNSSPTILNMGGVNNRPSAAKYTAASNDPIRAIRAQFA
jgi:SLT domain-containing protein